jgi:hypothetical protein
MPTPTPTPTANPYGPQLATPDNLIMSSSAAVPAPASMTTGGDVIKANIASAQQQNSMIAKASGKVGGSRKLRHKRHMRSRKHKRTNRHKRSNRHRRSKRGGATMPSISPRPTVVPVPQFGQNAGANAASVNLNGGAMKLVEQGRYDSLNGPSSTTHFQ